MKAISYNTVDEFVEAILCEAEDHDNVTVYAFKDGIVPLIGSLLFLGEFDINYMDISTPEWDGYDAEYALSILDNCMYVEKMYDDEMGRYLYSESDVAFIHEDCNSKLLSDTGAGVFYEYRVVELDGEDEDFKEDPVEEKDNQKQSSKEEEEIVNMLREIIDSLWSELFLDL